MHAGRVPAEIVDMTNSSKNQAGCSAVRPPTRIEKVVYATKDGDIIQSVYIDKDALGDVPPVAIQVVLTPQ